jgi:hypothetical protein
MTITAPRSSFRRSTERKVEDPNEELVAKRARQEYEELLRYEEVGFSKAAASVLVRPASMDEVFGDAKLYDDFGVVYG